MNRRKFVATAAAAAAVSCFGIRYSPAPAAAAIRPWPEGDFMTGMQGSTRHGTTICFADGAHVRDCRFINCDLWLDGVLHAKDCEFRGGTIRGPGAGFTISRPGSVG